MTTDRPNQLDELWVDWENKTLDEKQAILKKAVAMGSKVLFSKQDGDNLAKRALEVGKALNLDGDPPALITPNNKWTAMHDPVLWRARRASDKPMEMSPEAREGLERYRKIKKMMNIKVK